MAVPDFARILRASNLRFGAFRARGVPAILLGVSAIVLTAGTVRALAAAAPSLAEVVRETTKLVDAVVCKRLGSEDARVVDDMIDRAELDRSLCDLVGGGCLTDVPRRRAPGAATARSWPRKYRERLRRRYNRDPGMPGPRLLRCLVRRP